MVDGNHPFAHLTPLLDAQLCLGHTPSIVSGTQLLRWPQMGLGHPARTQFVCWQGHALSSVRTQRGFLWDG